MTMYLTRTWVEDGKLIIETIPQEAIYKREWQGLTEKLKDAFYEGFTSVETYNDTRLNDVDEEWLKYEAKLKAKNGFPQTEKNT